MPCSAHRRHTDVVRPRGMADIASIGGARGIAHPQRSVLPAPLDASRENTILTPETSTTQRRQRRLGGTTPIPVGTANGRPQARNKEGSCGNGQY
jgi:hypothetical protein